MGSPTKVQHPHQPCQPQRAAPVKMFAIAHTKVPPAKVQNGMMNARVRIHARTFARLGKKYEIASAMIATLMSGMPLHYHREGQLCIMASLDERRELE